MLQPGLTEGTEGGEAFGENIIASIDWVRDLDVVGDYVRLLQSVHTFTDFCDTVMNEWLEVLFIDNFLTYHFTRKEHIIVPIH